MKRSINKFIDWFEDKFNFIIDVMALFGGAFCIFLAVFVFINLIVSNGTWLEGIAVIFAPGLIGFFGIIILFALRITRSLTKK
jgi:ABC-type cobalamin transport system permease subunit